MMVLLPAYAMDHEIITYEVYPRTYLVTQLTFALLVRLMYQYTWCVYRLI